MTGVRLDMKLVDYDAMCGAIRHLLDTSPWLVDDLVMRGSTPAQIRTELFYDSGATVDRKFDANLLDIVLRCAMTELNVQAGLDA